MFDHKSMAAGGLYPGLVTTRSIANLGHFEVEVIITPVVSTGGGWVPAAPGAKPEQYRVTVKIRHNGKEYVDSIIVDDTEARVYAKLNGIETFTDDKVMISINGVQIGHEIKIKVNSTNKQE